MRKQEQEALCRLEAALMEQTHADEIPVEETEEIDTIFQDWSDVDYEVYNTDDADVDMDEYSEDVHRGRHKNSFLPIAMVFSLLLLAASIFILLQFLGVI